jgi:hypothetical protein
MAHSLTLPTIGVLALAGAGLGLHLGKQSISEINPIYFQEPPTRFHSDLSPYRSADSGGYVARMDMASPLQLGTGCVGCRTYPEEYFPQRDPMVDRAIEGVSDEAPLVQPAVAETAPDPDLIRRQSELERLQRYAAFAIGAEEEEAAAAAPADGEATAIQGEEVASADLD